MLENYTFGLTYFVISGKMVLTKRSQGGVNMDKKSRIRSIKNRIKTLDKKGLDSNKALDGKSVEDIARNKISYENFLKRYNRIKEQPKIKEEIEKFEQKRIEKGRENLSKISKKIIDKTKASDRTKNIMSQTEYNRVFPQYMNFEKLKNIRDINDIKSKLNKIKKNPNQHLKDFTRAKAKMFLYKYFQELMPSAKHKELIDKIVDSFGNGLDILNDSIDDIVKKIDILDMSDTEGLLRMHGEKGKFDEMSHRLDMVINYLNTEKGLNIKE